MRSTTLFGMYAAVIVGLVGSLGGLTLYSLEKSRAWDVRAQLAQESYGLHLQLEGNLYRLFKKYGDVLLIGEQEDGAAVLDLQDAIAGNLSGIRDVIAREIQLVGEEEIEELILLDQIEADVRAINVEIDRLIRSQDPVATMIDDDRLITLFNGDIDIALDRKIEAALAEERSEVDETLDEARAFRLRNTRLVYAILLVGITVLIVGLMSFNAQIRRPIIRLQQGLENLRGANYSGAVYLGGSREFRQLGGVLNSMADALAAREASRAEQKRYLEDTVAKRTAELQQAVDKLELTEENRKQLMADISHELRTPLAIILGEADVTLRTSADLSDGVSDSFARIRDAAKHTNQIVDDMLTVARFEAGKLRLDRSETDLRLVVHDAVSMFPEPVQVDMPDRRSMALIDPVRLRQAVLALLHNAHRYGGPDIAITVSETASSQIIRVEDNGPGLSKAEKSQAFERFFRGSNASGRGVEGTGLGLPVVKSIVEAHDGTVVLEDRDGGGLRVVMTLPKKQRVHVVAGKASRKSA